MALLEASSYNAKRWSGKRCCGQAIVYVIISEPTNHALQQRRTPGFEAVSEIGLQISLLFQLNQQTIIWVAPLASGCKNTLKNKTSVVNAGLTAHQQTIVGLHICKPNPDQEDNKNYHKHFPFLLCFTSLCLQCRKTDSRRISHQLFPYITENMATQPLISLGVPHVL